MVCLANPRHLANLEAATLEDSAELQVGLCTVNRVNDPLDLREVAAAGVPIADCREKREHTFPSAVNLRELDHKPRVDDSKLAENLRRAGSKEQWLSREDELADLVVRKGEKLVRGVALYRDLAAFHQAAQQILD